MKWLEFILTFLLMDGHHTQTLPPGVKEKLHLLYSPFSFLVRQKPLRYSVKAAVD